MSREIVYSPSRDSYNLIVDGEWYAEGTYEQMDDMSRNWTEEEENSWDM